MTELRRSMTTKYSHRLIRLINGMQTRYEYRWVLSLGLFLIGMGSAGALLAQALPPQSGSNPTGQVGTANSSEPPQTGTPASQDPAAGLKNAVETRLAQVQADETALDGPTKDKLITQYQSALVELELAITSNQQRMTWEQAAASAPDAMLAAQEQKRLLEETKEDAPVIEDSQSFDEVQQTVQNLEAELATAKAQRIQFTEQEVIREKRRGDLPQLIADLRSLLAQVPPAANTPAGRDSGDKTSTQSEADDTAANSLAAESLGWLYQAKTLSLESQILALEAEHRAYEAVVSLLPLQIEVAQMAESRAEVQLQLANERLEAIRSDRILTHEIAVRQFIKTASEEEKKKTEMLLEWIVQWRKIVTKQASLAESVERVKTEQDNWRDRRMRMDGRVESGPKSDFTSFNSWVGLRLRKQRRELPNTRLLNGEIARIQEEIQYSKAILFELEDELRDVKTGEKALDRIRTHQLQEKEVQRDEPESSEQRRRAQRQEELLIAKRNLLAIRKALASEMKLDVDSYDNDLLEAATANSDMIRITDSYRSFIDQHILWIRSCMPMQQSDLAMSGESLQWLISYDRWKVVSSAVLQDVFLSPWWYGFFAVGFAVLLMNKGRLLRVLAELSAKASRNNCVDFSLTLSGLFISVLLASQVAIALLFAYWRLASCAQTAAVEDAAFISSVAHGILLAFAVLLPTELLRQISREGGLGTEHFGWDENGARRLTANLNWLVYVAVPLAACLGILTSTSSDPRWESSLGRVVFIVLMLVLTAFFALVFLPRRGVFSRFLQRHEGGWIDRTRYIWYPAIVAGPLVLAVASFLGYQYTAQRIAFHFDSTLWTIVVLTVVYCLLARWLVLNRRKLMLAQARARLEEAAAGVRTNTIKTKGGLDEPVLSMVDLNEQTRRMLKGVVFATGLGVAYWIWSDVLPAIELLDRFQLPWSVAGETADEKVYVTLGDMVLVIPVVVLVVIAGRNVPGLMEISLLQHLPLTNAAKYAITTLTRYAIFALGIVLVANTIGLQWQSIQWLVAALGVGLGFGLQEIFANFVSGVILLFEQPIRVGDTITVGDTTGVVSKIRMRAITIVNWDRQELIVPNKDLITGKFLNWTLSDSTNRVVVNVGVAYGTDIDQACGIIQAICDEHSGVMSDPRAMITFQGFGDNTLNIVVRAFLENLDNRLSTVHQLHQQIYRALNKAGIEISFPQRDLHIRSLPEKLSRWFDRDR